RSSSMELCNCQSNSCLIKASEELAAIGKALKNSNPTSTLYPSLTAYLKYEMWERRYQYCQAELIRIVDLDPHFLLLQPKLDVGLALRMLSETEETFK